MSQRSNTLDMTQGPFAAKILMFALPLAASSILQLLFNAADVVVVGQFAGSAALAAVGSNGCLINLLINLFMGLSVGANVVAARFFGAKDMRSVSETVHTSIFISLIGGVVLSFFGFFAARTLLGWMATPLDVIGLAAVYLRIYFIGMPVLMLYNFGSALLRAIGDTRRPLICLAVSGVLNVILNLVFVIGFQMSVAGVALATIISEAVSAAMVLYILMHEQGPLHLDLGALRIYPGVLRQILAIGVPAGLQGTVFSLSNVVIQSAINSFGSTVVAGSSAASNLENFIYVSMNACHQACVTFTSQNVGARRYRNIDRVLRCSMLWVCVIGIGMGLGGLVAGRPLLHIYSSDPGVIDAGYRRLSIIVSTYFLCGIMDVWVGSLRGMGYSVMPMIVSLLGSCVFRLVYIATVFQIYRSEPVLYMSYPISWILTLATHTICFIIVRRKFRETPAPIPQ
jgi:putative MATE family efflux protein